MGEGPADSHNFNLGMQTKFYTPHTYLQDFVNCIMIVDAEVDEGAPVCIYPPTPQSSLFFYIHDKIKVKKAGENDFTEQPRSVLVGLQTKSVVIDINKRHKAVRVGFHPGGMYRLLGFKMGGTIDGSFDAEDIFGNEIKHINDRLQECESFDEIRSVIEQFLLKKVDALKMMLPFDLAMLEMLKCNGNISMEKVASTACLSLRQFERVSKERIGMSPKLYGRLIRFSKAYRLYERFPGRSWTNIAHECGYFDQMHFIRDFKIFASDVPGAIEKLLKRAPVRLQAEMRL